MSPFAIVSPEPGAICIPEATQPEKRGRKKVVTENDPKRSERLRNEQ